MTKQPFDSQISKIERAPTLAISSGAGGIWKPSLSSTTMIETGWPSVLEFRYRSSTDTYSWPSSTKNLSTPLGGHRAAKVVHARDINSALTRPHHPQTMLDEAALIIKEQEQKRSM